MKRKNLKSLSEKFTLSPRPRPPPFLLQVKDMVVSGDDVCPMSVVWSDKDGEQGGHGGQGDPHLHPLSAEMWGYGGVLFVAVLLSLGRVHLSLHRFFILFHFSMSALPSFSRAAG